MLMVFADEQAAGFDLRAVQARDGVKMHTGSYELTCHDVWVTLQVVQHLPGRPRGARWGSYEHKGLLGSE